MDRRFDVAVVVQRVVDGQHGNAKLREDRGVQRNDVIRKELERVEALTARERVAGRRQPPAEQSDAFPGILVQIAHAHVEHRAAENVDERIADAVDRVDDRRHHRRGHPSRPQALMRVAQRHVDEAEDIARNLRRVARRMLGRHQRCSSN